MFTTSHPNVHIPPRNPHRSTRAPRPRRRGRWPSNESRARVPLFVGAAVAKVGGFLPGTCFRLFDPWPCFPPSSGNQTHSRETYDWMGRMPKWRKIAGPITPARRRETVGRPHGGTGVSSNRGMGNSASRPCYSPCHGKAADSVTHPLHRVRDTFGGCPPSSGTPGEGWGGGSGIRNFKSPIQNSPTLTLPRSTGGGDQTRRFRHAPLCTAPTARLPLPPLAGSV